MATSGNAPGSQLMFPTPVEALPRLEDDVTAEEGRIWWQFETYQEVTELDKRPDKYKVSVLLTCILKSAIRLYNGLPFASDDEQKDLKKTLDLFEEHFVGKRNDIYERYRFHTYQQNESQSNLEHITALRRMSSACNFESITLDDLLHDRIVCGICSQPLRQSLLKCWKLTLEECIELCWSTEDNRPIKQH